MKFKCQYHQERGFHSQFSPVAQSCPTLCDPMGSSMPGLPVNRQLLEFTQTQVHSAGDAWFPWLLSGKESCQCRRCGFNLLEKEMAALPFPGFLPGKSWQATIHKVPKASNTT